MEKKRIEEIIEIMEKSKVAELALEFPDGFKISMKKNTGAEVVQIAPRTIVQTETAIEETVKTEAKVEKKAGNVVKSPMVGTFYSKPSPTSNPYVELGQSVQKGNTLCIIEAMKLMNEIESEFSGKIVEILVQDGQSVEYGTELFIIE